MRKTQTRCHGFLGCNHKSYNLLLGNDHAFQHLLPTSPLLLNGLLQWKPTKIRLAMSF